MAESRAIRGTARVVINHNEGGANWRLRLACEGWPGAAPGQFVMLSPGFETGAPRFDPLLPRPMAVFCSSVSESCFEVRYKIAGRGTRLLASAREGDPIACVGPLGKGFPIPAIAGEAVLVGGGTGIASLYELARLLGQQRPTRVLLGARTRHDLMAETEFRELSGVELDLATEDGSAGQRGLVTELLAAGLGDAGVAAVYACGPARMMAKASELCAHNAIPCFVSLENHMACGFGVCLGCAVPRGEGGFALVCRDGPVFPGGEVAWAELL
jgi:dihydroorotate dehydrogenase electron transfer subunit